MSARFFSSIMETKIKYFIVTNAYYGTKEIEVFENEDLETKFNTIIKNIEDNPDSSITSIRVWNVETSSYEDDKYYVDRLFTVMNRDHNRYLDHRLEVRLDTYDDDSDHPFYEDYSVL